MRWSPTTSGTPRAASRRSDVGGVVATDLVHRFPGFVRRMCMWNTVPPMSVDAYAAAGLDVGRFSGIVPGPTGDYREWQGAHPDELAAMLNTESARRLWVAGMYTSRLWASPGSFSAQDVAFMTEPFAQEARLRAGWAVYQLAHGRPFQEMPMNGAVDDPYLAAVRTRTITWWARTFLRSLRSRIHSGSGRSSYQVRGISCSGNALTSSMRCCPRSCWRTSATAMTRSWTQAAADAASDTILAPRASRRRTSP